jgi:hypothetical protein
MFSHYPRGPWLPTSLSLFFCVFMQNTESNCIFGSALSVCVRKNAIIRARSARCLSRKCARVCATTAEPKSAHAWYAEHHAVSSTGATGGIDADYFICCWD